VQTEGLKMGKRKVEKKVMQRARKLVEWTGLHLGILMEC
jgi:hypothetical protein